MFCFTYSFKKSKYNWQEIKSNVLKKNPTDLSYILKSHAVFTFKGTENMVQVFRLLVVSKLFYTLISSIISLGESTTT